MVEYYIGSNPIEISDLESEVKVTVTENVFKDYEKKNREKFKSRHFKNQIPSFDWTFQYRHFDAEFDFIEQEIIPKFINVKKEKCF